MEIKSSANDNRWCNLYICIFFSHEFFHFYFSGNPPPSKLDGRLLHARMEFCAKDDAMVNDHELAIGRGWRTSRRASASYIWSATQTRPVRCFAQVIELLMLLLQILLWGAYALGGLNWLNSLRTCTYKSH